MTQWPEAPKPGLVPLRPLSLGDLLGGAFRLFLRTPRTTLGTALLFNLAAFVVSAVVILAAVVIGIAVFASVPVPGRPGLLPVFIVFGAIAFLLALAVSVTVQAILPAVYILETSHQVVGEKMRLGGLLRQARGRLTVLVGWLLLLFAAAFVGFAIVAGLFTLFAVLGGHAGVVVGSLIGFFGIAGLFVVAIWIGTKTVLVPSILVLERVPLGRAIARSWQLTRLNFWRVFGVIALVAIIVGTATNLVSAPISIGSQLFGGTLFQPTVSSNGTLVGPDFGSAFAASRIVPFVILALIGNLVTVVITAIGSIIQSATIALLYVDLRIRRERLDLELLRYVHLRDSGAPQLPDPYRPPQA